MVGMLAKWIQPYWQREHGKQLYKNHVYKLVKGLVHTLLSNGMVVQTVNCNGNLGLYGLQITKYINQ